MIGEGQWGCARATLAAVDGYEIGTFSGLEHFLRERLPESKIAHGGFDPNWQSGFTREQFDEFDQRIDIVKGAMIARAQAILTDGHTSSIGDFLRDFFGGKHTAQTGFCALRKFDFDGFDRSGIDRLEKFFQAETAIQIPARKVTRTDLPNEISTHFVILRDAALTGGLHRADLRDTSV